MANLRATVRAYWKTLVLVATPLLLLPFIFYFDNAEGRCAYAILIMAVYWITEALPIPVTSLLPMILFPLLQLVPAREVSLNYFKDVNMLLLGSLAMAVSVERSNLHRRIAIKMLLLMGTSPKCLMFSIMLSTWFLSMWISNTATTAMMIPVATAVLDHLRLGMRTGTGYQGDACLEPMAPSVSSGNDASADDASCQDITVDIIGDRDAKDSELMDDSKETSSEDARCHGDDEWYNKLWKALVLSIVYAANLGGIGTLTGTGTNLVLMNHAEPLFEDRGLVYPVTFAKWMVFAAPLSALCLVVAWLWLVSHHLGFRESFLRCGKTTADQAFKGIKQTLQKEYDSLGDISFAERCNIVFFSILLALWLTRNPGFVSGWGDLFPKGFVTDSLPAILMTVLLFTFPAKKPTCGVSREPLLDWPALARGVPWGVLILVGGGFSMADACKRSGLSEVLGQRMVGMQSLSPMLILLLVTALVGCLTNVASNMAVVNIFLPVLSELTTSIGLNPLYLMVPTIVIASCAFMLPVSTTTNAIAFSSSSGRLRVIDMVSSGLFMNIACILIMTVGMQTWGQLIFDLDNGPWILNRTTVLNETPVL